MMPEKINACVEKWTRYKDAPIPDYTSEDGRFRLFKSGAVGWHLQDRKSPKHPKPVFYPFSLKNGKEEAERRCRKEDYDGR